MCKRKCYTDVIQKKMQLTNKVIRDLARHAFEMRPNKNTKRVSAFVYWWEERDILFFDLKHYTCRIVHTSEFDIDDIIVTIHLVRD